MSNLYAVKMVGEGRIGGYLVVFGAPDQRDLEGDFFTKNTEFGLDWYDRRPALYQHGMDVTVKQDVVGVIDALKMDEVGVWAEAQLDLRKRYVQAVQKLVDQGVLQWSSGSLPHLVKRVNGEIKSWIIVEGSLTPTPAEPRMTNIQTLKSAYEAMGLDFKSLVNSTDDDEPEAPEPEALKGAAGAVNESDGVVQNGSGKTSEGVKVMSDNNGFGEILTTVANLKSTLATELNAAMDGKVGAVKDAQKNLEDKITALETKIKNAPAFRGPNGGGAGEARKTFGETAMAIKSAKVNRRAVADEFAVKAQTGDTGAEGGFLLPEEFGTQFLTQMQQESGVLDAIQVFPVRTRSGRFPILNVFTAASGAATPFAAGMTAAARAEGGTHTETGITFEDVRYNIENAVSGKVQVTRELVKDSPVSLEAILRTAIVNTARSYLEYYVFNGTGVGQPLGIFNGGALVGVDSDTNGTFARADASEMYSHLHLFFGSEDRVRWVTHRSMEPDIDALDASTATSQVLMTGGNPKMVNMIKGYRRVNSPHVPVANSDGCVNLIDFSAYLLFREVAAGGEGVEINYFDQNSLTHDIWTFDCRMDGQPLTRSSIQYADAYALSPFIQFEDDAP